MRYLHPAVSISDSVCFVLDSVLTDSKDSAHAYVTFRRACGNWLLTIASNIGSDNIHTYWWSIYSPHCLKVTLLISRTDKLKVLSEHHTSPQRLYYSIFGCLLLQFIWISIASFYYLLVFTVGRLFFSRVTCTINHQSGLMTLEAFVLSPSLVWLGLFPQTTKATPNRITNSYFSLVPSSGFENFPKIS